jgi:5-methylthioadenosine/S-adenosylhomocysteine deaminase
MLRTGTTTINECWWHQPESAKVIRDSGIRGVVAAEIREMDSSNAGFGNMERKWDRRMADQGIDEAIDLIENWHGKADGRITCRVAPDGPDRCTPKLLVELKELADKYGIGLHAHTASIPGEAEFMLHTYGKRTIHFLNDLGLLGPGYVGAHCAFVDDSEIEVMRETGMHMAHTAYLVAKRGYYPPMERIYKAGVSVALGSDWLSNDMWKVMRFAALIPRILSGNVGIRSGKDVLTMATIGGAKALGMEKEIGSLEPGKKADIIAIDMRQSWFHPFRDEDLAANLVFNGNSTDVREVYVDGKHVVADGRMKDIDERALIGEARAVAKSVWDRAAPLFAR